MIALAWQCALLCVSCNLIAALSVRRAFIAKPIPLGSHGLHHDVVAPNRRGFPCKGLQATPTNATTSAQGCCPYTAEDSIRTKAILLCGGVSQRMNGMLESLLGSKNLDYCLDADSPPYKQFISMHGVPLFVYSLAEFLSSPLISEVTIATKPEWNSKVVQLVDSSPSILLRRRMQDRGPLESANTDDYLNIAHYSNHLRKFPFFFYDLKELRCVLSDSSSWNEAIERAIRLRDTTRYKVINLCISGDHRATTVYNALRRKNALDARLPGCCREAYIALVHDAVRPLIRYVELESLISSVKRHGAAIPAVSVSDTIKVGSVEDGTTYVSNTPDRSSLFAIQTPQAFKSSLLMSAYANVLGEEGKTIPGWLTDDASFVEHLSLNKVAITPGHRLNIKVTTWEDIRVCSQYLKEAYFAEPQG